MTCFKSMVTNTAVGRIRKRLTGSDGDSLVVCNACEYMARSFANMRGRALSTAKLIDYTALQATRNTVFQIEKNLFEGLFLKTNQNVLQTTREPPSESVNL